MFSFRGDSRGRSAGGEAGQGKLWLMLGKDPKDMEPEEEEKK